MANSIGSIVGDQLSNYIVQSFCPVPQQTVNMNATVDNNSVKQKMNSPQSVNHRLQEEIRKTEEITKLKLADPSLPKLDEARYGKVSQELSKMNSARMQR